MAFICKIGLHPWNECKCTECGKIRNSHHDFSENCIRCSKCGKSSGNQHDFTANCEKCSKCGLEIRLSHDWTKDFKKCATCGKERTNYRLPASIECTNESLIKAIKDGNTELCILLILNGIDVNFKKEYIRFTPLGIAIEKGYIDIVKILITAGADVNLQDSGNNTPLHLVSDRTSYETRISILNDDILEERYDSVKKYKLLDEIEKIKIEFGGGNERVHKNRFLIAELLIANGANKNVKNEVGYTPFDLAKLSFRSELVDILKNYGIQM